MFSLQPGRLKKVQGIGWYLDEKNLAQVSTNLLDFEVTALHTVYEETCREARVGGVGVSALPDLLESLSQTSTLPVPLVGTEPPSGGLAAGGPGAPEGPAGCCCFLLPQGEPVCAGGGAPNQAGGPCPGREGETGPRGGEEGAGCSCPVWAR